MELDPRLTALRDDLRQLHEALRDETMSKYRRMNPLVEDLTDWKERGSYWAGEERGITIYNSTTVVGNVEIGRDTWIGPYCSLDGTGGLTIGRNCALSLGTQLLTHDTMRWALTGGQAPPRRRPTVVGDCCFLGSFAVVTAGVRIGDRCVVGAGAVVTRDVQTQTIVAGVPAVPIGRVEVDGAEVRLEYHK